MENVKVNKSKKREKIVVHYTDGSVEEYTTGIVYTLVESKENPGVIQFQGQHCNTRGLMRHYSYGLGNVVVAMLDNLEKFEDDLNE